jgi:translation initiation factor 2B subunit (eIF-2B alpha/beta/delta family)
VAGVQNSRLQNIQNEILKYFQGEKFNPEFLDAAALDELAIYKSLTISAFEEYLENIFPCTYLLIGGGTAHKRTSSRLRRTNDRSVPSVHEDHEDDENAEIGVGQQCRDLNSVTEVMFLNPGFDVTPNSLISGIITERGIRLFDN